MKHAIGTSGLVFNEPLLWEKGSPGRTGYSMPARDVEPASVRADPGSGRGGDIDRRRGGRTDVGPDDARDHCDGDCCCGVPEGLLE